MKKCILLLVGLLVVGSFAGAQILGDFNTPGTVGNFEKSGDSGYGLDSLTRVTDPTNPSNGVMAVHITFDGAIADTTTNLHGRFDYGHLPSGADYVSANGSQYVVFWVYLDSLQHIPDSLGLTCYAMDNVNWSWYDYVYYAKDIPKSTWYPLAFNIAERNAVNPSFNITTPGKGFMTGMQFQPNKTKWHGTILVDNIGFVGHPPAGAKVLGDFNTPGTVGNFEKSGDSGYGLDSLYRVIDPKDPTNGVMAVHITFDGAIADTTTNLHGRFDYGHLPSGADYVDAATDTSLYMVFWVYLDSLQNFPDSLGLTTYAMDNVNWSWYDYVHYAKDIPKSVWYPLSFPLAQRHANNPSFVISTPGKGFMTGMQFQPNKTKWHGTILVDNVALLSAKLTPPPAVWTAADFESGKKQGFYVPSYASGTLSNVVDTKTSNGSTVLQGAANFGTGTHIFAVQRDSVPMKSGVDSVATSITIDLYLPNKMSTGGRVKFFVSGGTNDSIAVVDTISATRLQPNAWSTLAITKLDSLATKGKFDPTKPARIGLVISYPTDSSKWAGNVWVDNLIIHGEWFSKQLGEVTVGVAEPNNGIVKAYQLYNNYPNPFNPTTVIEYDVQKDSKVVIQIFDVLGREVATLVNERQAAGSYKVPFNATKLSSGVYLYRMTAGSYVKTQKMMLLK